jgi:hypothetical protein
MFLITCPFVSFSSVLWRYNLISYNVDAVSGWPGPRDERITMSHKLVIVVLLVTAATSVAGLPPHAAAMRRSDAATTQGDSPEQDRAAS